MTENPEPPIPDAELQEWQRVARLGLGCDPLATQRLVVEVYRLRALLEPLVAHPVCDTGYDMSRWCAYCRAVVPYTGRLTHAPDCPWLKAKEGMACADREAGAGGSVAEQRGG